MAGGGDREQAVSDILVTGGAGFIGGWVCKELENDGHTPIVFDHVASLEKFREKYLYVGDVRDSNAVTEAVSHVDGVIHLAAILGSQETVANPKPAIDTNINGAVNVMEACVQWNVPLAMTSVGNSWLRSDGAGTYTIVKECAADLFQMYRNYRGLRGNLVRPMNAYGPGQKMPVPFGPGKVRKILPSFICRALSGQDIEVYGDGEQISDMCWVGDVANILTQALYNSENGMLFPTVEVGPSESMTVNEVAQSVAREAALYNNGAGEVSITHLPMRAGERKGVTAANTQVIDTFYNIELMPFEDGLRQTVKYFNEQLRGK